jgi:hypothetical protein
MTPQDRVAALEGMLERIRRNASRPRPAPAVAAAAPAPAPAATPPAADPVFDRTVDELLEAPIPLVQHSSAQPRIAAAEPISLEPPPARSYQPPPRDEASLEAEEAAIPLVTAAGDVPAMSGVQPVSAELAASAEELGEDDLISVAPPPPEVEVDISMGDELDFQDEEEEGEIPASSKRPRVAASMEEALATAPADEHEVPIKTPPPESGPQEAMPAPAALESPRLPDIREAFERGPTPEQLGETIELPEAGHAELELDVHVVAEPQNEPVSEELEVALPVREAASAFDANLSPPSSARDEIRRYDEQAAAETDVEATQVVRRREIAGAAVARVIGRAGDFMPKSFLELLEASLRLGRD